MAYIVNRFNGTQLVVVEDGTVDQTTDLKLIGRNYSGYGEAQNENYLHLLENFSGTNAPAKALDGQVWYDSSTTKLKFYTGSAWKTAGGTEVSSTEPAGLDEGDLWWSSTANQLYGKTAAGEFILVGPQSAGSGTTQMLSVNVTDNADNEKTVIVALINDVALYVISNEEFTLKSTQPAGVPALGGFTLIKRGITLVNSATGITQNSLDEDVTGATDEPIIWGTASNALKLGGFPAADYVRTGVNIHFPDTGFAVGNSLSSGTLQMTNASNAAPKITTNSSAGLPLIFAITPDGGGSPISIASVRNNSGTGRGIFPESDNLYTIGSVSERWSEVYAVAFKGTADKASTLDVGGTGRSASTTAGANTIAARDSSGNLTATIFNGTATQARYADLAEKYTTSENYPVGTCMTVAHAKYVEGEDVSAETTACKSSDICMGVISDNPAYLMNADADGQPLALKGRVPVRCTGAIQKGMPVYAWEDGVAGPTATRALVGIALETNADPEEKLVEVMLK